MILNNIASMNAIQGIQKLVVSIRAKRCNRSAEPTVKQKQYYQFSLPISEV